MSYVFRFDCFNEVQNSKLDNYERKVDHVTVAVVAESETEAEATAKNLVSRETYELDSITELSELNSVYN